MSWIIIILVCALNLQIDAGNTELKEEYCFKETFQPTCPVGEVVVITYAMYGRMNIGKCVTIDHGYLGCSSDELVTLDKICSGRESCSVDVVDIQDYMTSPLTCVHDLMFYLEANYKCLTVKTPTQKQCSTPEKVKPDKATNFLSSTVSMATNCGTNRAPWLLEAKPGQRINVTLWDFRWNKDPDLEHYQCMSYGYILDVENDEIVNICGGTSREKHLYTSVGHTVQIVFDVRQLMDNAFLISYEALGCPQYQLPPHSWADHINDTLVIGCYSSDDTWTLRCVDNNWLGILGTCDPPSTEIATTKSPEPLQRVKTVSKLPNVSKNHVTVFTMGCFTLLICCTIIVLGIYCTKRYEAKSLSVKPVSTLLRVPKATLPFSTRTLTKTMEAKANTGRCADLPEYTPPIPKDQRPPPIPHRMSSYRGDMSESMMSDYLAPQGGDDNSVQYYILENPTESGGKEEMYQSIHLFSSLEHTPGPN